MFYQKTLLKQLYIINFEQIYNVNHQALMYLSDKFTNFHVFLDHLHRNDQFFELNIIMCSMMIFV